MSKHHDADIGEETNVRVKISTAWGVIASIVATAIWLTFVIVRVHWENQSEHSKLLLGLAEIQSRSEGWVTKDQLEDSIVTAAQVLHPTRTNFFVLRDRIRQRLRAPKDF